MTLCSVMSAVKKRSGVPRVSPRVTSLRVIFEMLFPVTLVRVVGTHLVLITDTRHQR